MKRGELTGPTTRRAGPRYAGLLPRALVAGLIAFAAVACSDDDGAGPGNGGEQVAVSIQPTSAELETGKTETFTATVTGTSNTAVTWQASCGSVSGQGATVTYTAPATPGTCTLTVTSQADQTKSAAATITVKEPPPPVVVSLDPGTAVLSIGARQALTATVTGTENTSVTWEASCGLVSGSGNSVTFEAPWEPGECTVTATSKADPEKSAAATITVTPIDADDNLLTNWAFDADLSGWGIGVEETGPAAVWNEEDATGDEDSGSAELRIPRASTVAGMSQCFPSGPGRTYRLGGTARLLQAVEGVQPVVTLRAHENATCTAATSAARFVYFDSSTDWMTSGDRFTTPEGTVAVAFSVVMSKPGVPGVVPALFDDLFVVEEQ